MKRDERADPSAASSAARPAAPTLPPKPVAGGRQAGEFLISPPAISLPKGGGAIRGIGEKFTANPVTGTGSMSVPIATSPGRGGFGPQLALSYDSGAGNGPFGLGWSLSLPSISRKTDKGLPRYLDYEESDTFLLAGAEDLVPFLDAAGRRPEEETVTVYGERYKVRRYRPRIEGSFAWIEHWARVGQPSQVFWRSISRDNTTTWYGRTPDSRIHDPSEPARVFQWLICETCDDKGNAAVYSYQREDGAGIDRSAPFEANRLSPDSHANTYLKRIRYGNIEPFIPTLDVAGAGWIAPDADPDAWMFEVVFDYGDHPGDLLRRAPDTLPDGRMAWPARRDPFSTHRPGFEVRTWRLCRRVLMFHHFPAFAGRAEVPEVGRDCLVRSTDFDYEEPAGLAEPLQSGYTVLKSVTHRSYQRVNPADTGYARGESPPVTFTYSRVAVDTTVRAIAADQMENLPVGTQGPGWQWVDLDGEGLSGVLTEQGGAWFYKPNRGDGRFGPMRAVARVPAVAALSAGRQQLMDLAGDGEIDLVDFGGPTPGFHERDRDVGWKRHVPFASLPNIDWQDPNLRF
ncbi:MAG TPA: SpvB/TcaC N-terminal domain-containing protein, partial [Burkholderiales bacterium]|nr:SpvB/TcaC N-terminal domain-containing protein [Burkholderiales bacterium]